MGSIKKRRKAKINKHKRRKKLRLNRHKKRLRFHSSVRGRRIVAAVRERP
jgi:hypothetical protein